MMKILLRALLLFVIGGLVLVGPIHVDLVHASSEITGIISSDATWTKENSPYSLTGPVLVNNGVTLIIEPGVTVYLNAYYIRVDGTFVARGSDTDKIRFEISSTQVNYVSKEIEFTSLSTDWNEETGSGCIIEKAIINTKLSVNNSPKISNNIINARISVRGESPVTIANNTITNLISVSNKSSVVILNNNIVAKSAYSSTIAITGGSAVISNNNITGYGNVGNIGIDFEGEKGVYISDNIISGFKTYGILAAGESTIERNLIFGNYYGIVIGKSITLTTDMYYGATSDIVIRNNTIKDNSYGIYRPTYATTIIYNNIQNNSDYNIRIISESNITVPNNWWGTTDTQTINQTMFDFKNDFNLGTITFTPFLTTPNTEATPNITIPEFSSWIILPIFLTATLIGILVRNKIRKKAFTIKTI